MSNNKDNEKHGALDKIGSWFKDSFLDYSGGAYATSVGVSSQASARTNGPGDVMRHAAGAAEGRRRFGLPIAKLVLDHHELKNIRQIKKLEKLGNDIDDKQRVTLQNLRQEVIMDKHNNRLGLELGRTARTVEDNERIFRNHLKQSGIIIMDGRKSTEYDANIPIMMPKTTWDVNPKFEGTKKPFPTKWPDPGWTENRLPDGYHYKYGSENHRFLPYRVMDGIGDIGKDIKDNFNDAYWRIKNLEPDIIDHF